MIVLDANLLSEWLRFDPHPSVLAWSAGVDAAAMVTTAITEAELRVGRGFMPEGARRQRLAMAIDEMLTHRLGGRVLPFDSTAAGFYAAFVADRRRQGRPAAAADAMIAAVARARGAAAIATRNIADFAGCGVPLIDPWATA